MSIYLNPQPALLLLSGITSHGYGYNYSALLREPPRPDLREPPLR